MNKTKIAVWAIVIVLLAGCVYLAYKHGYVGTSAPSGDALSDNKNFSQAIDILRNGGDKNTAKELLQTELTKAQQAKQYGIAGIIQINLALSQSTSTNDINQLTEYAKTMTSVAVNQSYTEQTRTFAYAFLGELFARIIALHYNPFNSVMDVTVNAPEFVGFKVLDPDGTANYHDTIIAILRTQKDKNNPLLDARLASLLIERITDEMPDAEARAKITEAKDVITTAQSQEKTLQTTDTLTLYPEYLYLEAQALGHASVIQNGKFASLITENVSELYDHALTAAAAGTDRGIESSVRYQYALYLMLRYDQAVSHTATDTATLNAKVEELLKPLYENASLRATPQVTLILSLRSPKEHAEAYALIQKLATHSPSFKKLLAS